MNDTELSILSKIDNKKNLDEDDLKYLVFEGDVVETINGDNQRWERSVESIVRLGERYFIVEWSQGLTEGQDNYFSKQLPAEVEKKTFQKTITVTEWVKK